MLSCGERNLDRRRPRSDQIAFAIRSDAVRHPLWFCLKTKSASPDTNIRTNRRGLLILCFIVMKNSITIYESRWCTYSTKPAYLLTSSLKKYVFYN